MNQGSSVEESWNEFGCTQKPVLMTGGTGFLGLHLLRGFLLAGRQVRLLAHAGGLPAMERVHSFLKASGSINRLPRAIEELVTVFEIDIDLPTLDLSSDQMDALTRDVGEIWHVAATVMLDGRDEKVWRTNVTGTENVLRLVERIPAQARLRYISTAFVAGRRRDAVLREDDSTNTTEFENAYERSKHAAEGVVRRRAVDHGRSALILRPSILVPGAGHGDTLPEHTLGTVSQIVRRMTERRRDDSSRLLLRLGADPRAQLNMVQVDWAADAMCLLAARITSGIRTIHVVHEADVPVRSISAALEDVSPVRMRMMPAMPAEPSDAERLFYRKIAGFLPYLHHRSQFDTTAMRRALPDLTPPPPIGRAELRRCMQPNERAVPAVEIEAYA